MNPENDPMLILGKIVGVFGVQGWVKIYSYTSQQEDILRYSSWYLKQNSGWSEVKLLSGKRRGKGLVAHIEGVTDRDAALALSGTAIGMPRTSLPNLSDDEYYWTDLVGLNVFTVDGRGLGSIDYLFETGANDVMVVKGDRERWLPWIIGNVVKSVDLTAGTVIVDWDPDF